MFDAWKKSGRDAAPVFRKGALYGAELPVDRVAGEGAELASRVIHTAGEHFGSSFYDTWNGQADVRLFVDGDVGVLAVMEMGRPGDDYGEEEGGATDTPTFAWRVEGQTVRLVASRTWRDTDTADALGIEWPAREAFERFTEVQGWGE